MSSSSSSLHEKISAHACQQQVDSAATHIISSPGGDFQPPFQEHIQQQRKMANPAPLGLAAFALTAFVLSLVTLGTSQVHEPDLVVALAFGYGGVVQLLAGMWEMAAGNTFGATVFSSYGGFWISYGIILSPQSGIVDAYSDKSTHTGTFSDVFALYLWAWFIFTTLCVLLTLRSTVAFASLFIALDATFLCLALAEQTLRFHASTASAITTAGGVFGIITSLLAWYNMFAGMADETNFWFRIPVSHLPWSEKRKAEISAA